MSCRSGLCLSSVLFSPSLCVSLHDSDFSFSSVVIHHGSATKLHCNDALNKLPEEFIHTNIVHMNLFIFMTSIIFMFYFYAFLSFHTAEDLITLGDEIQSLPGITEPRQ